MLQDWRSLTAIHWRYPPDEVAALLPKGFRVDTFDDSAWVGLIPFHMERIRLPHLPPFGRLSSFPETNVRTYIVDPRGHRGVYFFSLDISRLLPVLVARVSYQLPYCWSTMSSEHEGDGSGSTWSYSSRRRWPKGGGESRVTVRVGRELGAVVPGGGERDTGAAIPGAISPLDGFLSARWALGSSFAGRLVWAGVEHEPWRLFEAEVIEIDESLFAAAGLRAPQGECVARWSPGVAVRIGRPQLV